MQKGLVYFPEYVIEDGLALFTKSKESWLFLLMILSSINNNATAPGR